MGSKLKIESSKSSLSHNTLVDKNTPYQHELSSIYRRRDGANLSDIIDQLSTNSVSVKCEFVSIQDTTSNIVTFNNFVYNVVMDVLLVFYDGVLIEEGPDKHYVKYTENSIKLNFTPREKDTVFAVLAGTISSKSFGDSIYSGLTRFTQLADTFSSYFGNENKVLAINNNGTGIVPISVKASHDLHELSFSISCDQSGNFEMYLDVPEVFYITGIKATPRRGIDFRVSLLTTDEEYIYDSGDVENVLWDIMKIPVIVDNKKVKLVVKAVNSVFNFHIYYEL